MSAQHPGPWWASGTGGPGPHDPDPLEAHRAARRGARRDDGDETGWDERATPHGTTDDAADGAADGRPHHASDVCGVCPICRSARVLGETRPELLGHLTEAAHHLAAAFRAVVEPAPPPRGAEWTGDEDDPDDPPRGSPRRVRRIDLD